MQWRFKTETNALWVNVIRSLYGVDGGLVLENGNRHPSTSGTWSSIISASRDIDSFQVDFSNSFTKIVGDGSLTAFWSDRLLGEDKLRNVFPRLYSLEEDKEVLIKDRVIMTENNKQSWNWRREPFGRAAGDLENLNNLLPNFSFDCKNIDRWSWSLSSNGHFTVRTLSILIDDNLLNSYTSQNNTLRNNLVPKKIEIFVWRALKKRIPVLMELDKRGIDLHSVRCPLCDDDLETVDHSLIFCKHVIDVWERVYKWWNMNSFHNFSINEICGPSISNANHMTKFGKKI
ncbi:uncharacterized protein [Rutidosis leptorrhynchoides]|uniref:uncharacterized protein n=1 Tax=Rutidosis leptorrhynchoides TaxID=125765 RepID=UPI003A9952B6